MRKKMVAKITKATVSIALALLLSSCGGSDSGSNLRDVSLTRECRANMNTLCTDQANYCDALGHWADSIQQLDEFCGRPWVLTCPFDKCEYQMWITEEGYQISCPNGHGSIETGRRSWVGEGTDESTAQN